MKKIISFYLILLLLAHSLNALAPASQASLFRSQFSKTISYELEKAENGYYTFAYTRNDVRHKFSCESGQYTITNIQMVDSEGLFIPKDSRPGYYEYVGRLVQGVDIGGYQYYSASNLKEVMEKKELEDDDIDLVVSVLLYAASNEQFRSETRCNVLDGLALAAKTYDLYCGDIIRTLYEIFDSDLTLYSEEERDQFLGKVLEALVFVAKNTTATQEIQKFLLHKLQWIASEKVKVVLPYIVELYEYTGENFLYLAYFKLIKEMPIANIRDKDIKGIATIYKKLGQEDVVEKEKIEAFVKQVFSDKPSYETCLFLKNLAIADERKRESINELFYKFIMEDSKFVSALGVQVLQYYFDVYKVAPILLSKEIMQKHHERNSFVAYNALFVLNQVLKRSSKRVSRDIFPLMGTIFKNLPPFNLKEELRFESPDQNNTRKRYYDEMNRLFENILLLMTQDSTAVDQLRACLHFLSQVHLQELHYHPGPTQEKGFYGLPFVRIIVSAIELLNHTDKTVVLAAIVFLQSVYEQEGLELPMNLYVLRKMTEPDLVNDSLRSVERILGYVLDQPLRGAVLESVVRGPGANMSQVLPTRAFSEQHTRLMISLEDALIKLMSSDIQDLRIQAEKSVVSMFLKQYERELLTDSNEIECLFSRYQDSFMIPRLFNNWHQYHSQETWGQIKQYLESIEYSLKMRNQEDMKMDVIEYLTCIEKAIQEAKDSDLWAFVAEFLVTTLGEASSLDNKVRAQVYRILVYMFVNGWNGAFQEIILTQLNVFLGKDMALTRAQREDTMKSNAGLAVTNNDEFSPISMNQEDVRIWIKVILQALLEDDLSDEFYEGVFVFLKTILDNNRLDSNYLNALILRLLETFKKSSSGIVRQKTVDLLRDILIGPTEINPEQTKLIVAQFIDVLWICNDVGAPLIAIEALLAVSNKIPFILKKRLFMEFVDSLSGLDSRVVDHVSDLAVKMAREDSGLMIFLLNQKLSMDVKRELLGIFLQSLNNMVFDEDISRNILDALDSFRIENASFDLLLQSLSILEFMLDQNIIQTNTTLRARLVSLLVDIIIFKEQEALKRGALELLLKIPRELLPVGELRLRMINGFGPLRQSYDLKGRIDVLFARLGYSVTVEYWKGVGKQVFWSMVGAGFGLALGFTQSSSKVIVSPTYINGMYQEFIVGQRRTFDGRLAPYSHDLLTSFQNSIDIQFLEDVGDTTSVMSQVVMRDGDMIIISEEFYRFLEHQFPEDKDAFLHHLIKEEVYEIKHGVQGNTQDPLRVQGEISSTLYALAGYKAEQVERFSHIIKIWYALRVGIQDTYSFLEMYEGIARDMRSAELEIFEGIELETRPESVMNAHFWEDVRTAIETQYAA